MKPKRPTVGGMTDAWFYSQGAKEEVVKILVSDIDEMSVCSAEEHGQHANVGFISNCQSLHTPLQPPFPISTDESFRIRFSARDACLCSVRDKLPPAVIKYEQHQCM